MSDKLDKAAEAVISNLKNDDNFPDWPFVIDFTVAEVVLIDRMPELSNEEIKRAAEIAVEISESEIEGCIAANYFEERGY